MLMLRWEGGAGVRASRHIQVKRKLVMMLTMTMMAMMTKMTMMMMIYVVKTIVNKAWEIAFGRRQGPGNLFHYTLH